MRSMFSYPKAAVERAMKVQEVILRAMAKRITWWQAAEIIGISDRQMRRWRERYEEFGYDGLFDRRQGKPSPKRVPVARVEQVLGLYRDRYFDLNVQHFHEKLQHEHQIELSYTWVKLALQGAGLVTRGRKRGVHRKRRPRRPLPGMLLHIDGSHHRWFQDERWYDLIVILDDATSEIYYAQLVEEESTATVLAALRAVVERKGLFCALYSDRGSHLQAVALNEGLRCKKRLWRERGREQLESFQLAPWASRRRRDLLALLDRLNPTIAELTEAIEQEAEKCPEAQRLRTHPGVGRLTALAFVLIIGRAERFQCGKQIACYLGLVPLEDSSGDRRRLGHITKQGNSLLRFLLVEAAQVTVRSDQQWRSKYFHLAMRRGRKIAKVAMARRLAIQMYWMMRKEWDYEQVKKFGSHAGQPGNTHGVQ